MPSAKIETPIERSIDLDGWDDGRGSRRCLFEAFALHRLWAELSDSFAWYLLCRSLIYNIFYLDEGIRTERLPYIEDAVQVFAL